METGPSRFHTRRAAKLKQLAQAGPFVAASLNKVKRQCGKPHCRCSRGQPHEAYTRTYKVQGKTKTVHVPKELVEEVKQWVQEYKRIKKLIREVSNNSLAIIRRHGPASRALGR